MFQEETVRLTFPSVLNGWVKDYRPDGRKLFTEEGVPVAHSDPHPSRVYFTQVAS